MSVSKIYTENPFVDELVYYVKLIAPNCVIKNETEATNNETLISIKESDLYLACYEGRAIYELIPSFPVEVLAEAGVPGYLREDYSRHKDHIPTVYHEALVSSFMPYYVNNYEEKNNYYRMLIGLPNYNDSSDYVYLTEDLNPGGLDIDYDVPLHLQPDEILATFETDGTLDTLAEMYPDKPYIKYISKGISLYDARIAIRFQLLYIPDCGSDVINNKFKVKFELNRDYVLRTIYSDAFKFQSEYYDSIITIIIVIQTMIDIIGEVQEHIARKDVFDARCIKYIFQSYGVPFYDEIPIKYQIKIMKNLNDLLKYKSTPTCMLDICKIFGFDAVNIYKYFLLRNRNMDDNGDYIFSYKTETKTYKDKLHPVQLKSSYVKCTDGYSVPIPYPFPKYRTLGNIFKVTVGDYLVYEGTSGNTYSLNNDICVFNNPEILKYDISARYGLTAQAITDGYLLTSDGLYKNGTMLYDINSMFESFEKLIQDEIFEENSTGIIYKYESEDGTEYSYDIPTSYRKVQFDFYYTDTYSITAKATAKGYILNENGLYLNNKLLYSLADVYNNAQDLIDSEIIREVDKLEPIDTTDFPIKTISIPVTIDSNGAIITTVPEGFTQENGLINVSLDSVWLHPDQYTIQSYDPLTIYINFYDLSSIVDHEAVVIFMYTNKYNIHPSKASYEQEEDDNFTKIPVPIDNYLSAGHKFFATYGTTLLSPSRYYTQNDNTLHMYDTSDTFGTGRDINYNFMYIDHDDPTYIILRQNIKISLGQRVFNIQIPTEENDSNSMWEVYDNKNDPLEVDNPQKYSESAYTVWKRLGVGTLTDYQNKLYQLYVIHGSERFFDHQYTITKGVLVFSDSSIALEEGTYITVEFRFPRDPNNTDIFKKDSYKVSFVPTTYDKQRVFDMTWPYSKFVERGNSFYIQVNGRILTSDKYCLNLDTNTLTIYSIKDSLDKNSELTICYYFRRMNEFNILFTQSEATAIEDKTNEFGITFPFDNYIASSNGFFVTVGGVLIDPTRYDIVEQKNETIIRFKNQYVIDKRYDLKEEYKSKYTMKENGIYDENGKFLKDWYTIAEGFTADAWFEEKTDGPVYSYHSTGKEVFRLSYGEPILTTIIGKGRRVIFNFIYHSAFSVNSGYVNNKITYVNVSRKYDLDEDPSITIPYPYPTFLEDSDSKLYVSIDTHLIQPVDYDIVDGKIYISDLLSRLKEYNTNIVTFDFVHSKASTYEVLSENNDKSYKLLFCKIPLEGNLDDYMRHDENYLDYNTLTSGDKLWRGDNTAEYVQSQILNQDFTFMRTKYISIDDIQNMANLFLDLPYFFTMFFDDVKLEERLKVQLYSIKPGMNFRLNDVFVFMIIMAFEFNDIEDTITRSISGVLYLRGFNFKADIELLKKDIAEHQYHHEFVKLTGFNVWANMYNYIYNEDGTMTQLNMDNYEQYLDKTVEMDRYVNNYLYGYDTETQPQPIEFDPQLHEFLIIDKVLDKFVIPKKTIPTYQYLMYIYETDKKVLEYITERMYNANNKDIYDTYKKIYDALMKIKYSRLFFKNAKGTGYCDTYSEFLQYRNSVLYSVVTAARKIEDTTSKKNYIMDIMKKVIDEVSEYLETDDYKYLFSKFPGSSTDAVKTYIKLIINFFKSYKIELTGINSIFTIDSRSENAVRPIDGINRIKSILNPETDIIPKEDTDTTITVIPQDPITIDDMIYMYEDITIDYENIDDCYGKHLASYYEGNQWIDVMPYIVLTESNISNYISKRVKLQIH